jgi:hypothetical protein
VYFTPIFIAFVVWYGCETSSLTLRDERRLRVFKNRLLRRIFESKKTREQGNRETP